MPALYIDNQVTKPYRKNWLIETKSTLNKNGYKKPYDRLKTMRDRYQTRIARSQVSVCKIEVALLPEGYIALLPEGYLETMVPFEMLEHNIILKMTPKEKFKINIEIKKITKAKPKIVEPDWI